jgi:hypothetical protein
VSNYNSEIILYGGLALLIVSAVLILVFALLRKEFPYALREIPTFARMRRAIGLAIEDGSRVHFSIGRGGLNNPWSAAAFVGLATVRHVAAVAPERYDASTGRATGLTPFSYVAGAIPVMHDENISTNVIVGNFGLEVALLADAAERQDNFTMVASDNIPAQAVLFASGSNPLIGEELYAVGAYVQAGAVHNASLRVQDLLRWVFIVAVVVGALLKLVGIL